MLTPLTLEFGRFTREKTICLVLSSTTFVILNPLLYISLQIPSFSLWVKKTGQEFLALEVCLDTQRTREGPCVTFNSLHCLPRANLSQAQSLSAHSLWMEEWKVKYAFKCKAEDWCSIVAMSFRECEICCRPRRQKERGQLVWEAAFRLMCTLLVMHYSSCSSTCEKQIDVILQVKAVENSGNIHLLESSAM